MATLVLSRPTPKPLANQPFLQNIRGIQPLLTTTTALPLVQATVISGALTVPSPRTQQPNKTKVKPGPTSAQNPTRASHHI